MELKWLEDFVMLANTASFSRAAEARNVTQSAFSRRIKQLEAWCGTPLISRATIPAELTPEGKTFLPIAQEAIRTFHATREVLRPDNRRRQRSVNIASLHTLTVTMVPDWLDRIDAAVPGIVTKLIPDRGGIEANLEALVSGEADMLLTYAHPYVPMLLDPEQFDWIVLGHEAILPVIAPHLRGERAANPCEHDDFLAHAAESKLNVPYLDYGPDSFFGTALRRLFTDRPFRRHIVHENSISVGLRELALHGWGLCWLPEMLVKDDLSNRHLILASPEPEWQLHVEIRLYRYRGDEQKHDQRLWQVISQALSVQGQVNGDGAIPPSLAEPSSFKTAAARFP